MLKRGLMIVLFLVLLTNSALAWSTLTTPSPAAVFEGTSQSFEISINNYNQSQKIIELQIILPDVNITNVVLLPLTTWRENHNDSFIRWFNGTVNTNSKNDVFEFKAFIMPVLADKNITLIVTKINEDSTTASETHTITILNDPTPPVLASLSPANGSSVFARTIRTITANVQENESQIQAVTYTYGDCNATNTTISLACNGSICTGQANFTSFNEGDTACYTLTASNNVGGASTQTGRITFTGIPPSVFDVKPALNSLYTITDALYITANVTDDGEIDTVIAVVQYPNRTTENITLTKITGTDKYSRLFNTPNLIGPYQITIIASDKKGNINNTETTNFTIVPEYNFIASLNPATARPGRTVIISGTIKLDNGTGVPENKAAINIQGTETNITLTNGTFSHTFSAPSSTGTYNIQVKVYANNGYTYSTTKRLTVSNPSTSQGSSGTGWGWNFDDHFDESSGVYIESSRTTEAPETQNTEDSGTTEAPAKKTAPAPAAPKPEPTPEEVIDDILNKPSQITGSAVGLGSATSLLALLLLIAGIATLAYSNTKIRNHIHTFTKEKVGNKFSKNKKEEKPSFSDEEWEEYFRRLRGD